MRIRTTTRVVLAAPLLLLVSSAFSAGTHADLMTGAEKGDIALMKSALQAGLKPDTPNWEGITPLMKAAIAGNIEAAAFLLESNADLHARRESSDKSKPDGRTAVMYAITNKKNEMVKFLIEKGARINSGDATGYTSLMFAAGVANAEAVKMLLDKGVSTDAQDDGGITAVTAAAWGGDLEVLKMILAKADSNAIKHVQHKGGQTVLHHAASKGFMPIAQFALEKGVDVNGANGPKGWTPIMEAAWNGKHDMVRFLADKGANLNHVSKDEWTPLMIAAKKGDLVLAEVLIEKGVDVHYTDKNGINAVVVAALNKKMDVLRKIVGAGGRALHTKL